jgi:hypothetical protein
MSEIRFKAYDFFAAFAPERRTTVETFEYDTSQCPPTVSVTLGRLTSRRNMYKAASGLLRVPGIRLSMYEPTRYSDVPTYHQPCREVDLQRPLRDRYRPCRSARNPSPVLPSSERPARQGTGTDEWAGDHRGRGTAWTGQSLPRRHGLVGRSRHFPA